jgi:hypothetical protein
MGGFFIWCGLVIRIAIFNWMKRGYVILVLVVILGTACRYQPIEDSCKIVAKGAKMYDLCIDQKMVSKPHDTIDYNQKKTIIDFPVWFRNNSGYTLKYMIWTGDPKAIFRHDNKNLKSLLSVIDANFPYYDSIASHEMRKYEFHYSFNKDSIYSDNQFKVGVNLVKVGKEGPLVHVFRKNDFVYFGPGYIIWSNPVKVPLN